MDYNKIIQKGISFKLIKNYQQILWLISKKNSIFNLILCQKSYELGADKTGET